VNRDIDFAGEKRSLDFRREQAFATSLEIDNFDVIATCDDDFGLDCEIRIRTSKCLLNHPSLCARKLTAACAENNLPNHRENLMRDTLQGKLPGSLTARKRGADFR
jgi:hypothetical protein